MKERKEEGGRGMAITQPNKMDVKRIRGKERRA
jgi:hypothetical protein